MKKKTNIGYKGKDENAFALSTGDLMAGLLFIFILLLMGALLQVQKKQSRMKKLYADMTKSRPNCTLTYKMSSKKI